MLVAPDDERNGWPGIVVGQQDNGYVVLFDGRIPMIPVYEADYEIVPAVQGFGYPWDSRVKVFGQSSVFVGPSVLRKYVDCCGDLTLDGLSSGVFTSDSGWNETLTLGVRV